VWAFGFLFGIITLFSGYVAAIVPAGSTGHHGVTVTFTDDKDKNKTTKEGQNVIIVAPPGLEPADAGNKDGPRENPKIHMSRGRGMGVLFCIILLLVIVITNVPLRGLWSVITIVTIILLALIFQLAGWWDDLLRYFALLDIRINAGGYFFIATTLLIAWLVTVLVFDRQVYIVFTPGQVKVCTEIGGGEKVYDAMGLHLEKQRSDLFRHWILGLGSGDLIVKTGGAQAQQFDLPNVMFIGRKVAAIEELMKRKVTMEVRQA
jgi:hypothetical protein